MALRLYAVGLSVIFVVGCAKMPADNSDRSVSNSHSETVIDNEVLSSSDGQPALIPDDVKADFETIRQAAELGDPDAQVELGDAYLLGESVTEDPVEACAWYKVALDNVRSGITFSRNTLKADLTKLTDELPLKQTRLADRRFNELTAELMLIPAVLRDFRAAGRLHSEMLNARQLLLAIHSYEEEHGRFPGPVNPGPDGKAVHSWRVAILPHIGFKDLYEQYNLNEPWDSESNKKVLAEMPDIFRGPNASDTSTNTSYLGFSGPNTALGDGSKGVTFRDVTDGESNTLLFVETQSNIPWTKPEDISCDEDTTDIRPGGFYDNGFYAAFTDGSAQFVSADISNTELRHMIIRNDKN